MRNRAFCALAVGVLSLQPFTTSRAQTLSAATQIESYLTTVIETALYGQFSAFENPKINIRLAPAAQHLAPCATSLHADKKSPDVLGTESWWVSCPTQWKIKATSVSSIDMEALTATRPLKKGHRLQGEDVAPSRVTLSSKSAVYREREQVIGSKLRRPIRASHLITSAHLEQNYVVLQGHSVTLRYRTAGFTLETVATAESNGLIGDTIWVRSRDSGRLLSVKVVGDGEVEQF